MSAARRKPLVRAAGDVPLHVAFTLSVSRRLYAQAQRRGVKPSGLVGAVMKVLTDDDSLLEAVLDGDSPADLAPGVAFDLNGLTRRQGAVLFLLARHADEYAVSNLSEAEIAGLLPEMAQSTVHSVLAALADRLLVARVESAERLQRPYSLTEEGWRLANTLGEFGGTE